MSSVPFSGMIGGVAILVGVPFGIAFVVVTVIEFIEWMFAGRSNH